MFFLVDDKKFTDEVMNQNQQLENKNSEMEDEISTLNRHIGKTSTCIESSTQLTLL